VNSTIDTSVFDTTTHHPLGGATMGDVCDSFGRALGQEAPYVTDGALIPARARCGALPRP